MQLQQEMNSQRLAKAVLIVLVSTTTGAMAQETAISVLPEVQVTAPLVEDTVTEGQPSYTSPAIIIGGKTPQSQRSTPQSVSVITQQRLVDQNLTSLDAALAQSTGIAVNPVSNRSSSLFARGFLIDTAQLDGVPVALPTNNYGFDSPDLAIYDHVEVLRGSAGLLNGAGTPGAVIGLTRKRATGQRQIKVNASLGSWNNKRAELDVGGPLNDEGSLRGRAVLMKEDRDFYYDVATQNRTLAYGVLDYDLSSRTRLSLGFSHQDVSGIPVEGTRLPRYSNGADLHLPRSTFLGAAWNREKGDHTEWFAEAEHRFDSDWKLKVAAVQTLSKAKLKTGFLMGAIDPDTGSGALQRGEATDSKVRRKGLDAFLSGHFDAWGRQHEMVLGGNFSEHSNEYDYASLYARPYDPVDIFNYDPYAVAEPADVSLPNNPWVQRTSQNGVYGTLRLKLADPLTLVLGARHSHWRYRQHYVLTGVEISQYSDTATTPFAGVVYDLNREWSAYASYADVFTVQNAFGIDGKRLDPVTGINHEIGLKGELFDGRLNASLAFFQIDRKNMAERDISHTGPTDCNGAYCFVAGGETRSRGFEAEVTGALNPRWNVFAGYTYNTTKYIRNRTATGEPSANEGQPLAAWVPKHIFRMWSTYQLPGELNRWQVGAGVNAQSNFYRVLNGQRMEQRGLATWNAQVRYRISDHWSAALNVNNVFDKTYYSRFNLLDQGSTYGEPRNLAITLRGMF